MFKTAQFGTSSDNHCLSFSSYDSDFKLSVILGQIISYIPQIRVACPTVPQNYDSDFIFHVIDHSQKTVTNKFDC